MNNITPVISEDLKKNIEDYINTQVAPINKNKLKESKLKSLKILLSISRKHILGCVGISLVTDEAIVSKKFKQIKDAKTVKDVDLIMATPKIINICGELKPKNDWVIPEEEIMIWSISSLNAPLSQAGHNRYLKLFKELFPEKFNELSL